MDVTGWLVHGLALSFHLKKLILLFAVLGAQISGQVSVMDSNETKLGLILLKI